MAMPEDAYTFAVRQLKKPAMRREPWPPGLLIDLAKLVGVEFGDDRQWGQVFRRLAKDGYIRRAGLFPRETSNRSYRPGWEAV
jgi:hypothetical protein